MFKVSVDELKKVNEKKQQYQDLQTQCLSMGLQEHEQVKSLIAATSHPLKNYVYGCYLLKVAEHVENDKVKELVIDALASALALFDFAGGASQIDWQDAGLNYETEFKYFNKKYTALLDKIGLSFVDIESDVLDAMSVSPSFVA